MNSKLKQPLAGIRIVVAEDGPITQRLLTFQLERAGAVVRVVENGQELIDSLTDSSCLLPRLLQDPALDLLLLDLQMPILDGYKTTQRLRSMGARFPIIALTASESHSELGKCLQTGFDDCLFKPLDSELLIESCRKWTRGFGSEGHCERGRNWSALADALARAYPMEPLSSQFADDLEMLDLLQQFVASMEKTMESIRSDFEKGDLENLHETAHQLMGSAAGYGYPKLSDAATRVVVRIRAQQDTVGLENSVVQLLQLCNAVQFGGVCSTSVCPLIK